jgi:hypothetical protein
MLPDTPAVNNVKDIRFHRAERQQQKNSCKHNGKSEYECFFHECPPGL